MRIGIASSINVSILKPFIKVNCVVEKLDRLTYRRQTPAVDTLILSLLKEGHFLRIFTSGLEDYVYSCENFELIVIKQSNNYVVRNTWGAFHLSQRIKKFVEKKCDDLDVIHAHWTYEYPYALRTVSMNKPVICTVRDWAPYIWKFVSLKNKFMWTFNLLMAKLVYSNKNIHFVANSIYTAQLLKKNLGIDAPIIPNSIKDNFFEDVNRTKVDKHSILCISSSDDKRKNIISLLRAFRTIKINYVDAKLILVGGCFHIDSETVKKYLRDNLLDGVVLAGFVKHEDLKGYLDNAEVFVTPSLEETFGNTLLEAISRKVPTVGGLYSGAVPYVLHHGDAGYLCDVSDPDDIARSIDYIFKNTKEVEIKCNNAYNIVKSEYSETEVTCKYINLYKSYC